MDSNNSLSKLRSSYAFTQRTVLHLWQQCWWSEYPETRRLHVPCSLSPTHLQCSDSIPVTGSTIRLLAVLITNTSGFYYQATCCLEATSTRLCPRWRLWKLGAEDGPKRGGSAGWLCVECLWKTGKAWRRKNSWFWEMWLVTFFCINTNARRCQECLASLIGSAVNQDGRSASMRGPWPGLARWIGTVALRDNIHMGHEVLGHSR